MGILSYLKWVRIYEKLRFNKYLLYNIKHECNILKTKVESAEQMIYVLMSLAIMKQRNKNLLLAKSSVKVFIIDKLRNLKMQSVFQFKYDVKRASLPCGTC